MGVNGGRDIGRCRKAKPRQNKRGRGLLWNIQSDRGRAAGCCMLLLHGKSRLCLHSGDSLRARQVCLRHVCMCTWLTFPSTYNLLASNYGMLSYSVTLSRNSRARDYGATVWRVAEIVSWWQTASAWKLVSTSASNTAIARWAASSSERPDLGTARAGDRIPRHFSNLGPRAAHAWGMKNYAIPMLARQGPMSELLIFAVPIAMGGYSNCDTINCSALTMARSINEATNWNCGVFIARRRR